MTTTVFSCSHDDGSAALLQITEWDSGEKFPTMSEDELKAGSKQYLLQFLSGVAEDKKLHGVMYCFINDSKIYSFHTQDSLSFSNQYVDQAVNAFESMEISK